MKTLARLLKCFYIVAMLLGMGYAMAAMDQTSCLQAGWTWLEDQKECCALYYQSETATICVSDGGITTIAKKLECKYEANAAYFDVEGNLLCCPDGSTPNDETHECECEDGVLNVLTGSCDVLSIPSSDICVSGWSNERFFDYSLGTGRDAIAKYGSDYSITELYNIATKAGVLLTTDATHCAVYCSDTSLTFNPVAVTQCMKGDDSSCSNICVDVARDLNCSTDQRPYNINGTWQCCEFYDPINGVCIQDDKTWVAYLANVMRFEQPGGYVGVDGLPHECPNVDGVSVNAETGKCICTRGGWFDTTTGTCLYSLNIAQLINSEFTAYTHVYPVNTSVPNVLSTINGFWDDFNHLIFNAAGKYVYNTSLPVVAVIESTPYVATSPNKLGYISGNASVSTDSCEGNFFDYIEQEWETSISCSDVASASKFGVTKDGCSCACPAEYVFNPMAAKTCVNDGKNCGNVCIAYGNYNNYQVGTQLYIPSASSTEVYPVFYFDQSFGSIQRYGSSDWVKYLAKKGITAGYVTPYGELKECVNTDDIYADEATGMCGCKEGGWFRMDTGTCIQSLDVTVMSEDSVFANVSITYGKKFNLKETVGSLPTKSGAVLNSIVSPHHGVAAFDYAGNWVYESPIRLNDTQYVFDSAPLVTYADFASSCSCSKGTGVASCTASISNNACSANVTCNTGYSTPISSCTGESCTSSCTINTITLDWNENGGTSISNGNCTYGGDLTLPSAPTYSGYTFAKWETADGKTYEAGEIIENGCVNTVTGVSSGISTSITAQWTEETKATIITVILDNQGATTPGGAQTVYYKYHTHNGICYYYIDNTATTCLNNSAFTPPTKTGYTFGGYWTGTNGTGTNYVNGEGVIINDLWNSSYTTSPVTLYAQWTLSTSTVSFDANGGTGGQSTNVVATYSSAMPTISTTAPTRTGYTFMGWYDNATYTSGTQYYDASGNSVTNWNKTAKTATLYAGWEEIQIVLDWNENGGDALSNGSCTYGGDLTLPAAPTRAGYKFIGWKTADGETHEAEEKIDNGCEYTYIDVTSGISTVITAQWTANEYTITYGSDITQTVMYDATFTTQPGTIFPTKLTKIITGWRTDSGVTYALNTNYTYSTADNTVLEPIWEECTCTNGTGVASCTPATKENNVCFADVTCNTGYDSASVSCNGTACTSSCTLSTYTITLRNYDNSATDGTFYEKYATGWYSDSSATMTLSSVSVPSRDGYRFRGYYTSTQADLTTSGGTGTRSIDNNGGLPSSKTTFTSNTSLYAAWAKECTAPSNGTCSLTIDSNGVATYTASCDTGYTVANADTATPSCEPKKYAVVLDDSTNGGTGGNGLINEIYNTEWRDNGGTALLSSVTIPTKTNSVFNGYFTAASNGTNIIPASGALPVPPTVITADTTLYAQFTACSCSKGTGVASCTITGVSNNACDATATCSSGYGTPQVLCAGAGCTSTCGTNDYTVTYNAGDGGNGAINPTTATYGASFAAATPSASTITKANATFAGWAVSGTSDVKAGGVIFSWTYTESKTFTATWNCNAGYTLDSNNACVPCASGTYKSGVGNVACSLCSDLGTVSVNDGAYSSVAGSTSNTACKYTAPAKTITGCSTVTAATVTYNGSAWPTTTYSVTSNKGYYISKNNTASATCKKCSAGTYQGIDGSTVTACSVCATGSYSASAGAEMCDACPSGYTANTGTTAADHNAKTDCQITCGAGTRVEAPDASCTTPAGGWYTNNHTVIAGQISPVNYCMAGFSSSGTNASNHDASTDCTQSLAGKAVSGDTIAARYVRLRSTGFTTTTGSTSNYGIVSEIQAFASRDGTGENLLLGKIGPNDKGQQNATDGNLARSPKASSANLIWDMESIQNIGSIKFALYSDGRTFHNVNVDVSTDNENWTNVFTAADVLTTNDATAMLEMIVLSAAPTDCVAGSYKNAYNAILGTTYSCNDACPAAETGWTQGTATGLTAITECYETKAATDVSSYCIAGTLQKNATSATAWGTSTISTALQAKAGSIVNGQTCSQCSGATYSAGGTVTQCTSCPTAESTWVQGTGTGWSSYSSCYETKAATAVSSYCSAGQLKKNATSATTWGTATIINALKAYAGSIVSDQTCVQCSGATYSAGEAATECIPCPTGYDADTTAGKSLIRNCKIQIPGGYYLETAGGTEFTQCSAGTYALARAREYGKTTSCSSVSAGSYAEAGSSEQTSCSSATGGIYTQSRKNSGSINDCYLTLNAGEYVATEGQGPVTCAAGGYCKGASLIYYGGSVSGRSTTGGRTACSTGTYNASTGSTESSACTTCTAGTYNTSTGQTSCSACGSGYYCTGGTARAMCVAGTYSTATNATSSADCVTCEKGYACSGGSDHNVCTGATYTDVEGQSVCTKCPTATNDVSNVTGYNYYNGGKSGDHTTITGCYANFKATTISNGSVTAYHCYIDTDGYDYGQTESSKICWVNKSDLKCDAAYYESSSSNQPSKATAALLKSNTCVSVGTGYYSAADILTRTLCPAGYQNGVATDSIENCSMNVAGGKYVAAANDSSATTCSAGTYKGAHEVKYGGTSSCNACSSLASGFYPNSKAGATAATSCYTNSLSGKYVASANATSATTCAAGTYKGSHTVNYGSTSSCNACSDLASGFYPNSKAGATAATSCYTNSLSGYYVANAKATSATKCAAGTYKGAHTVNYGSTSSCDACSSLASGFYPNSAAGSTAATACYTASLSGKYVASANATSATSCAAGTYKAAHTVNYGSTSSCNPVTSGNYAESGASSQTSCSTATNSKYTQSASGSSSINDCYLTLSAGKYVSTAGAGAVTCAANSYCASTSKIYYGGSVSGRSTTGGITACPTAYPYSPVGAGESGACGRKLHIGDNTLYLRSTQKTTPSLKFDYDKDGKPDLFGNLSSVAKYMTSDVTKSFKVNYNGQIYYAHDDTVQ